ncbi:MAG TPA: DUF6328 family protein [Actinomycetota bacterium]|jgi:hypothetical protein|nr:DUF6328 family protein [Actinomycetota bacterium]
MAPRETKPERLDRELGELLQELRVVLPGVQVLFAFLLTVPFSNRFAGLSSVEKALFLAALISAAVASALLISPSAFHRILFRERDKEWLLLVTNRLAIAGTVFLAVAMTCALFLIAEFLYGSAVGGAAAGAVGGLFLILWYAVPLARRARG